MQALAVQAGAQADARLSIRQIVRLARVSYRSAGLMPITAFDAGIAQGVMTLHMTTNASMNFDDDTTRYTLELDMIERDGVLGNGRAIELLRSEFALAINASDLIALSAEQIDVSFVWRSIPQEGVARYVLALELVERTPQMTDEQAGELLRRELQRAQNAGHFMRISGEDFNVTLAARERVRTPVQLRAA